MSQKILTLLGFASKAGRLSFGMNAAVSAINSRKAKLIVCAADVSKKSQKEITYFADKHNLPVKVISEDKSVLSSAVGKSCGMLSVNDQGFAQSILSQEETI